MRNFLYIFTLASRFQLSGIASHFTTEDFSGVKEIVTWIACYQATLQIF